MCEFESLRTGKETRFRRALGGLWGGALERNSSYLVVGSAGTMALGFAFRVFTTRSFSIQDFGLAVALFAFTNLAHVISMWGVETSLAHFLPNVRNARWLVGIATAFVALSSILTSLILLGVLLAVSNPIGKVLDFQLGVPTVVLGTVTLSVISVQTFAYIGIRDTRFSLAQVVAPLFRIAVLPAVLGLGSEGLYIAFTFGSLSLMIVNFIVLSFVLRMPSPGAVEIAHFGDLLGMFRFSVGNYGAKLLGLLPEYGLPIIVIALLGEIASARFNIAWTISYPLYVVFRMVAGSLLAEGSFAPQELIGLGKRAARFSLILALPTVLIVALLTWIAPTIFGAEYVGNGGVSLIVILVMAAFPFGLAKLLGAAMLGLNRIASILTLNAVIAATSLLFAVVLIEWVGMVGVGLAWLVGNSTSFFWLVRFRKGMSEKSTGSFA